MHRFNQFIFNVFLGFTFVASAEDWKGGLEVGATLTDGNSNTEGVNFDLDYGFVWNTKNEILIDAGYKYGESADLKNVDNSSVMLQYNRAINERVFGHTEARYEMDDIADLDHRLVVGLGPGLGYYFMKTEETELAAEIGFAWVDQDQAGVEDDWIVLRLAERFEHKFNDSSRIFQKMEYLPETEEFENYLLSFEVGVESGFTKRSALRISVLNKYDSEPEAGVEKNDVTLKGGIVFKL